MRDEFNFQELKAANRLPSPSGTVLAIMQLIQSDDSSVQKIAQLIQSDPALSGRLMKLANSAALSPGRPIVNVQDAMVKLGMQAVCSLVLSISLIGKYRDGRCHAFEYEKFWSESLAMAVTIASLTARERTAPQEEAFTLGLLADIGRLALATAWPEKYSSCLDQASGEEQLITREHDCFAIDHHAVSQMLLTDWRFPEIFRNALRQSAEGSGDDSTRTARLATQLAFARQLAAYCIANDGYREIIWPQLLPQAARHQLDDEALSKFIEGIILKWHEWGKLIEIKTESSYASPMAQPAAETVVAGLQLLLLEDDPAMRETLARQLAVEGHRVTTCEDTDSALKHIIEHKPQLVISVWRLKNKDGLQLCRTLRTFELGKNIYFILLSPAETDDALVEAFDAGVDDYVTKPVNFRILRARIRAAQRIIALQNDLRGERAEIEAVTAELAVANRRLEQLANTDLLTHLPNRRFALKQLEKEWGTAKRFNRPLSVLMLDLDYFKLINDTLGHDIGDQVLTHAAKVISETMRTNDVACRLGGEEFIVIAPNTDGTSASLLAERIRKAIELRQLKGIVFPRPVTVSIGVACSNGNQFSWGELVKRADQAVYQVKARNRNGVQLASWA